MNFDAGFFTFPDCSNTPFNKRLSVLRSIQSHIRLTTQIRSVTNVNSTVPRHGTNKISVRPTTKSQLGSLQSYRLQRHERRLFGDFCIVTQNYKNDELEPHHTTPHHTAGTSKISVRSTSSHAVSSLWYLHCLQRGTGRMTNSTPHVPHSRHKQNIGQTNTT